MSFIASIILKDRIIQVSDSRVVSETGDSTIIESDHAQKLFRLKENVGLAYCGVQRYGAITIEGALESFKTTGDLNLPPALLADKLRSHLADYWGGIGKGVFCVHLSGYHQGRPFSLIRFNPLPPADLVDHLHAPIPPWVLRINGSDDESIASALSGIRAPYFTEISPVQTLNHLVDIISIVIDRIDCCGGDVQVQIIVPDRIVDFKATKNQVLPRRCLY